MRIVVVGASSGLGRCIGVALGQRGENVALLARRKERLDDAATEAGASAVAIACDVSDETSCAAAIDEAARALGGVDALIYTPAIGPLAHIEDVTAQTWRQAFDTNVIGASLVTSAALPHLAKTHGVAVYLSSVSASHTPVWPGLGAYITTKAALEKLIEVWRTEHSEVAFTRIVVGDTAGGEGPGMTEFANDWDPTLAGEFAPQWLERGLSTLGGMLVDVEEIVNVVHNVITLGPTASIPTVMVTPRPLATPELTD
jgi:NAD(P)-dependent dehydrogenase (short-subunit alcohol dehydrogenase family)